MARHKKERPPAPAPMTCDEMREIRESRGWSYRDFAAALGKYPADVFNMEKGRTPVSAVMALASRSLRG